MATNAGQGAQFICLAHRQTATTSGDVFETYELSLGCSTGSYHEMILRNGKVQRSDAPTSLTNGIANHKATQIVNDLGRLIRS